MAADLVACRICGQFYEQVSHFHLTRKHGITTQKYKDLFPNADTFGEAYSRKRSNATKRVRYNADSYGSMFSQKISATMKQKIANGEIVSWNKGKTKRTDNRLKNHSLRIKALHANPDSTYNDPEYRKKLSETHKGHPNRTTDEGIKKVRNALLRKWADSSSIFNDPEFRRRRGRAIAKAYERPEVQANLQRARHAKPNGFEKEFANAYPRLRYVGDLSFWVGSKNPDFVIPDSDVCIDLFGDYWHTKEESEERIRYFEERGYGLFILWEHDWNNLGELGI